MFFDTVERPKSLSAVSTAQEFQALVLAGFGNSLSPLTDDKTTCKALLPIANKPMLYYPLEWCVQAGFGSVTVVCHQESAAMITLWLKNEYTGHIKVSVESPTTVNEAAGSADVLRILRPKIKADAVVLSCDLYTNTPPHEILDFYRLNEPSALMVLHDLAKNEALATSKEVDTRQYIGIKHDENRVLLSKPASDVDEEFSIRKSLLWKFPRVTVHTELRDAHLYILKSWVLDFIVRNETMCSLKDDVIPTLIKTQYTSALHRKLDINSYCRDEEPASVEDADTQKVQEMTVRALCFLIPQAYLCARANNIPSYIELNRFLSRTTEQQRIAASADISPKSVVGADCLIGNLTLISERCSIKRSAVGAHCRLGKGVNVTNCVIMDGVIVNDYARLDGCILSKKCVVGTKAKLSNCNVGSEYHVAPETSGKNENYVEMDDMMEDSDE